MDAVFGAVFLFVWSIIAMAIGLFGLFFRERAAKLNVLGFQRMYKLTHFPVFKWQAEQAQEEDQSFLIFTVSLFLSIAGIVTFLSLFGVRVDLSFFSF